MLPGTPWLGGGAAEGASVGLGVQAPPRPRRAPACQTAHAVAAVLPSLRLPGAVGCRCCRGLRLRPLAGLRLGRLARLGWQLLGCCCLSAWRARNRSSRRSVAWSWLVLLLAPPLPPLLWSCPGLICRAMGERDEFLLPWRTPAGSVLRCAPLAAESAPGARGRSPLQPGSPSAPTLLVLVRYPPLAALPVGRFRA